MIWAAKIRKFNKHNNIIRKISIKSTQTRSDGFFRFIYWTPVKKVVNRLIVSYIFVSYMKSAIVFSAILGLTATLCAQPGRGGIDNSSKQVTTKFEPKLIPASKLLLDPIVPRSENPKINVKFETPEFAWNTRKITRPIQPEKLKDRVSDSTYLSNYARIGGGNYGHTLGEIYLSNKPNANYSYNFSGLHLSANPPNSLREFSTNKFQLQGAKYYQSSGLETKVFYNRDKINFFGKDTSLENRNILTTGKIIENYGLGVDYDYIGSGKKPSFRTGLAAQEFNTNMGQNEEELSGYVNVKQNVKNVRLGMDVSGTYINMIQALDTNKFEGKSHNQQLFVDAFPHVKFTHEPTKLNLKIGAITTYNVAILDSMPAEKAFKINPFVSFEKTLTGLNLNIYGGLDGGLKKNSFRRLNATMPFFADSISVKNTYDEFNLFVGIKGKITQNAEFAIDMGGNSSSNFGLVVSNTEINALGKRVNDSLGSLQMIYAPHVNSVYFRSLVKYQLGEKLKLGAHAKVVNYSVDQNDHAWHLPGFTYSLNGNYTLGKNLELTAGIDGMSKRRNQVYANGKSQTTEIKGFMDLHARIDYRINGKGRLWVQGSNLLGNQYQMWYGFPNYGLTIMGGLAISIF